MYKVPNLAGGIVLLAMDQEALDEHVRGTGEFDNMDNFGGGFFRQNGDNEPMISAEATRRCNMSMTRPVTLPGVSIVASYRMSLQYYM